MNDQHPHAGHVGYDGHPTGSFDTDPLFGALPGHHDGSYETYDSGYASAQHSNNAYGDGYDSAYPAGPQDHSGQYDSAQWDTGAHQQASYAAYAAQPHPAQPRVPQQYDATGQWDTSGWDLTGHTGHPDHTEHAGHTDQAPQTGPWAPSDTGAFPTTTFSTTAFDTGSYRAPAFDTAGTGYDTTGYTTAGYETTGIDTGAYDATAWNSGATPGNAPYDPEQTSYPSYEQRTAAEQRQPESQQAPYEAYETAEYGVPAAEAEAGTEADDYEHTAEAAPPRPVSRSGGRSRRRTPAKRSALLTVAVPSVCVMSVAGIAAASVGGVDGGEEKKDDTTSMAAADPGTVKPVAANNELDTQLANLSADAENFADRASRTQERIDLKARQAADKKKRADEAARREALRPKFVLPVEQHGLSAYYGQAGVNWMSVHTGIDFPVSYGTAVMAATDGTVRTQYNSAYGNMAIVTAADGTETWYCHLSSTKIRSGSVQAGDVIAYSGSSGNSTGPHLHFEVRPGGGAAIDPMPWLRSHNINPN